jgi:hypothetical protein
VETTSICPSVTESALRLLSDFYEIVTGLFKKSCLASMSFMECSESHILLQCIYKILLLFSTFSNRYGKQKQVSKGGLHKTVDFGRRDTVKYIHYLDVQMNLFLYCLHFLPDSAEIR